MKLYIGRKGLWSQNCYIAVASNDVWKHLLLNWFKLNSTFWARFQRRLVFNPKPLKRETQSKSPVGLNSWISTECCGLNVLLQEKVAISPERRVFQASWTVEHSRKGGGDCCSPLKNYFTGTYCWLLNASQGWYSSSHCCITDFGGGEGIFTSLALGKHC